MADGQIVDGSYFRIRYEAKAVHGRPTGDAGGAQGRAGVPGTADARGCGEPADKPETEGDSS
jgi:hypothetical protein